MTLLKTIQEMATPAQQKKLKATKWEQPQQITQFLIDNKFEKVGSGYYSHVYASPSSDKVVKFSTRQDLCYLKTVKFMQKHPSKYFPKVYDIAQYKTEHSKQTHFVTILEKLQEVQWDQVKKTKDNQLLVAWLQTATDVGGELEDHQMEKLFHFLDIDTEEDYHFEHSYEQMEAIGQKFYDTHPFAKTFQKMEKQIGSQCLFDLHSENIMQRKDGTIIVIDPYAEQ